MLLLTIRKANIKEKLPYFFRNNHKFFIFLIDRKEFVKKDYQKGIVIKKPYVKRITYHETTIFISSYK